MAITKNEIYTRIVEAVKAEFPAIYYAGQMEPVPPSLPALFLRMISASVPQGNETLAFDSELYRASWEAQIFTDLENGSGQQAYEIAKVVTRAMQSLGFLLDMLEPIDNVDPSVFRLIGRWHRLVGYAAEHLPAEPAEPGQEPEPIPDPEPGPEPEDTP